MRKEFNSSLLEVEFGFEPALVYVKTILKKTLDEFETVNKMNELLQELWMELKESIKKIKEHSMKKKNKLETLRDKYLTLSREHQEAKSKIAMQEDLLIEREEEIKNLSEVNAQQQDKIGEANKVIYGFSNLATSIEILVKDHEQKKVEVTNLKQIKIEDSYNEGNQRHSKPRYISPYERNKENVLNNGLAILDEILKRQRPANDKTGLGYKRSDRWISKSKFEEDISFLKDQK